MPVRISAVMIVRNEARVLDACLASLARHVDETVVVDTGSEDATREIARAHGARVFEIPWPDDFAAARNHSLDRATGDWLLWIDADDRLHVPDGVRTSDLLDQPGWAGATLTLDWRRGFTAGTELRLFRNDPRIRFRGIIHENIAGAVRAVCRSDGLTIGTTPLRLEHIGYEGDIAHKHRRNLALLRRAVEAEPEIPFYWAHLAETLAALGETDEAIEAARRGIDIARRLDVEVRRANGSTAYYTLARLLGARGEDVLPLVEEALASFPEDCNLQFVRAWALVQAGRHEEAVPILDRLCEGPPAEAMSYDRRIFGEFAQDQRGVALMRLGRFAEAAEAFAAASAAAPENLSYRAKAVAMRGRTARAKT
ncbi:MAG TPA: glycosyltransferase [Beijerinckiaceae bacterium]|nr:glycosyltransferase [Beijerinckiaceae bacterium]